MHFAGSREGLISATGYGFYGLIFQMHALKGLEQGGSKVSVIANGVESILDPTTEGGTLHNTVRKEGIWYVYQE